MTTPEFITVDHGPQHKIIKCTEENCQDCKDRSARIDEMSKDWKCGCGFAYICHLPHCSNSVSAGGTSCCDARRGEYEDYKEKGNRRLRVSGEFWDRFHHVSSPYKEHPAPPGEEELLLEAVAYLEDKYLIKIRINNQNE